MLRSVWEDMRAGAEIDIETHEFPIDIVTQENDLNAQLKVPTKKGGATISKSSWEIGEGTFSRTTSSGTIEEEPYEDVITRLQVKKDKIEMGVLLSENIESDKNRVKKEHLRKNMSTERTIRIKMHEITDVRVNTFGDLGKRKPGISFETNEDVYKIGFFADTGLLSESTKFNKGWIPDVINRIQSRSNQEEPPQNIDEGNTDAIDKIERLKKLHDEGVLSDTEFEEKKTELLDDV